MSEWGQNRAANIINAVYGHAMHFSYWSGKNLIIQINIVGCLFNRAKLRNLWKSACKVTQVDFCTGDGIFVGFKARLMLVTDAGDYLWNVWPGVTTNLSPDLWI